MSLFFPYSPLDVMTYLADVFEINLSSLSSYETTLITIVCNLYFFLYWFIICYFSLKIFNRIWERVF